MTCALDYSTLWLIWRNKLDVNCTSLDYWREPENLEGSPISQGDHMDSKNLTKQLTKHVTKFVTQQTLVAANH